MMRTWRSMLVLGLSLALVAAACGDDSGGSQVLAASDKPRLDGNVAEAPSVVAAANQFAVDLYGELTEDGQNLVFSPHSAAIALAMTRAGADGLTAEEMDEVLHLVGISDPHGGFNALDQELAERSGTFVRGDGTTAELTLRIANALWGQEGTTFESAFLDLLAEQYGAGMRLVDYESDPEAARVEINDWVADQTENRIEDLIPEGALNSLTRLVLTNAVYLLAPWERPFEESATKPGDFHRDDGSTVQAEMMQLFETLPYASGDGWQAVQLPYAGRELAMVVIVPDEGSFVEFEAALDTAVLESISDGLAGREVDLAFPRFEFRTQKGLSDALKRLGLIEGFDPDRADFSGMTTEEKLFIADVIHEAFISVDEAGTEAAAATAVIMAATAAPAEPVELDVDRPFMFQILDTTTGATLFMGKVVDPTA